MIDIRPLTKTYAVAAQISPDDVTAIAAAGYRTIVCNRPDGEAAGQPTMAAVRTAAEQAGLDFVAIPFAGAPREPQVTALAATVADHAAPILAYCRTGTRCATVWALMEAQRGALSIAEIETAGARAGYDLAGLRLSQRDKA